MLIEAPKTKYNQGDMCIQVLEPDLHSPLCQYYFTILGFSFKDYQLCYNIQWLGGVDPCGQANTSLDQTVELVSDFDHDPCYRKVS